MGVLLVMIFPRYAVCQFSLTIILLLIPLVNTNSISSQSPARRLVFIGDSITADQYDKWSHYTSILANKSKWKELELINSGIGGLSVIYLHRFPSQASFLISGHNPDYVVSFLGLADLSYENETLFYEVYNSFIVLLLTEIPGVQIFLVRFSWIDTGLEELMEKYLEQIDKLSLEYDLPIADVYNITRGHPEYFVDGVHPNDLGAEIIALTIDNAFSQYLVTTPRTDTTISKSITTKTNLTIETTNYSTMSLSSINSICFPIIIFLVLPILGYRRIKMKK